LPTLLLSFTHKLCAADNGMISFWSHSDEGVNKPVVMTWNDQQIFTDDGIADAVIVNTATDESYLIAGTSWFDHSSPANAAAWQGLPLHLITLFCELPTASVEVIRVPDFTLAIWGTDHQKAG